MTRADIPSGTDRVAEVARARRVRGFDAIVNVQGDEPFVVATRPFAARSRMVTERAFPLGTAARARRADDPRRSRRREGRRCRRRSRAVFFARADSVPARPRGRRAAARARVWQHIGVYAYTPDALARWVALPAHPLERSSDSSSCGRSPRACAMGVAVDRRGRCAPGIDTEEDLERANARLDGPFTQDETLMQTDARDRRRRSTSSSPAASSRRSARASPPPRSGGCSSSADCA